MKNLDTIKKSIQGLLDQGEASFCPESESCRYRHTNDEGKELKCGVGLLILDEYYFSSLEGKAVSQLNVREALSKSGIKFDEDGEVLEALKAIQLSHDVVAEKDVEFNPAFIKRLRANGRKSPLILQALQEVIGQ